MNYSYYLSFLGICLNQTMAGQVYYMLAATMGAILLLCGSFPWRCFVFLQRRPGVMREMVEGKSDSIGNMKNREAMRKNHERTW